MKTKRTCVQCERDYIASSNHKKCPKCRAVGYSKCECGRRKTKQAKVCKVCFIPLSGNRNPNWRGGRTIHRKGYRMVRVTDHPRQSGGYVFEHILVMEEMLGRYLLPGENVHHKNGVRDDNSKENLELWVTAQPSGIRLEDAISWAHTILERDYGSYLNK